MEATQETETKREEIGCSRELKTIGYTRELEMRLKAIWWRVSKIVRYRRPYARKQEEFAKIPVELEMIARKEIVVVFFSFTPSVNERNCRREFEISFVFLFERKETGVLGL